MAESNKASVASAADNNADTLRQTQQTSIASSAALEREAKSAVDDVKEGRSSGSKVAKSLGSHAGVDSSEAKSATSKAEDKSATSKSEDKSADHGHEADHTVAKSGFIPNDPNYYGGTASMTAGVKASAKSATSKSAEKSGFVPKDPNYYGGTASSTSGVKSVAHSSASKSGFIPKDPNHYGGSASTTSGVKSSASTSTSKPSNHPSSSTHTITSKSISTITSKPSSHPSSSSAISTSVPDSTPASVPDNQPDDRIGPDPELSSTATTSSQPSNTGSMPSSHNAKSRHRKAIYNQKTETSKNGKTVKMQFNYAKKGKDGRYHGTNKIVGGGLKTYTAKQYVQYLRATGKINQKEFKKLDNTKAAQKFVKHIHEEHLNGKGVQKDNATATHAAVKGTLTTTKANLKGGRVGSFARDNKTNHYVSKNHQVLVNKHNISTGSKGKDKTTGRHGGINNTDRKAAQNRNKAVYDARDKQDRGHHFNAKKASDHSHERTETIAKKYFHGDVAAEQKATSNPKYKARYDFDGNMTVDANGKSLKSKQAKAAHGKTKDAKKDAKGHLKDAVRDYKNANDLAGHTGTAKGKLSSKIATRALQETNHDFNAAKRDGVSSKQFKASLEKGGINAKDMDKNGKFDWNKVSNAHVKQGKAGLGNAKAAAKRIMSHSAIDKIRGKNGANKGHDKLTNRNLANAAGKGKETIVPTPKMSHNGKEVAKLSKTLKVQAGTLNRAHSAVPKVSMSRTSNLTAKIGTLSSAHAASAKSVKTLTSAAKPAQPKHANNDQAKQQKIQQEKIQQQKAEQEKIRQERLQKAREEAIKRSIAASKAAAAASAAASEAAARKAAARQAHAGLHR